MTTIALLDPFSMAYPYGEHARAMGLDVIAVYTREITNPYFAEFVDESQCLAVYKHSSVPETTAYLKDHGVAAVVPGAQPALEFADLIADRLGVIGNPVGSIAARANKRAMKDQWAAHGVPCAAFHEAGDLVSARTWARRQGYPVVLKPPASAGAKNVFVCRDDDQVAAAFATITSEPDAFGTRFDTVLVEEYLDGDEYFMNLLHNKGQSELVSAAKYEKLQRHGRPSIYRNFRSLPLDDPLVLDALPAIQAANTAVEVRYGINDTEYKLTSTGLRPIEINNRLPGANTPLMIEKCSGLNCYRTNIEIFLGDYSPPVQARRFDRHYCVCCLINDRAGRVLGYRGRSEISRLASYDGVRMIAKPGDHWPVTTDLSTTWGLVRLVHHDREQLDRDAEAVHALMGLDVD